MGSTVSSNGTIDPISFYRMNITLAERFSIAGKETLRGNFGNAVKSLVAPAIELLPMQYRGGLPEGTAFGNDFWVFGNDGVDRYFDFTEANSSLNAYKRCPPVAAILNRKAQAYMNGKDWILDEKGKRKDKESMKPEAVKIRKLFANPNPIQSATQFALFRYMMTQLYGYAVVLVDKPFGFPNVDASAMWVLPNWLLEITESNSPFIDTATQGISRIVLKYKNQRTELPMENILIYKDFTPTLSSIVLPCSRIEPIAMPINNIIGAYESRNVLIRKRGPMYVISSAKTDTIGTQPLTPAERDEQERNFSYRYGLSRQQAQAIITSANVNIQTIGYDVAQLKLHEEVQESAIAVCNGLSYPPFLLGLSDTTYNNQAEASRGLYMETTIPEAQNISSQDNAHFKTAEFGIEISKDYSHVSALQEDEQKNATAYNIRSQALERDFKNNVLTLDMYRTAQDLDPIGDEFGVMYYYQLIQAGWVFGNAAAKPADNTQNNNADGTAGNNA
jgi:hypothetical protein